VTRDMMRIYVSALILGGAATVAQAAYMDEILDLDPSGYWRLGETSGTISYDISGNDLNGTYENGITLGVEGAIPEDLNPAVRFDGNSGYVHVGSSKDLETKNDLTLSLWAKVAGLQNDQILVTYRDSDTRDKERLYELSLGSDGLITYKHNTGKNEQTYTFSAATLSPGSWYNVTLTRDKHAKQVGLYVNGQLIDTYTYKKQPKGGKHSSLYIGSNLGGDKFFNGSMDEVAIFDRKLTGTQIASLHGPGTRAVTPEASTFLLLMMSIPMMSASLCRSRG